jgi:hypothetical protein
VIAILVVFIAVILHRVLRQGYAIAPWQEYADRRFGNKNCEPPIQLNFNDPCESGQRKS